MGNSPSTSKPATPTQRYNVEHAERVERSASPRSGKKQEPKDLISPAQHYQQHRSAASSAEASVVSAQGSTIGPRATGTTRPLSILGGNPASNSPSSRSSINRPRYSEDEHGPTKPVDVPIAQSSHHNTNENSVRSPSNFNSHFGDDPLLTNNPASASVTDMTYNLPRPPRLPLPIEEEVHTPGSPVIAPTDIGPSIEAIEAELDKDDPPSGDLTRKSSGLSNATDDEDAEELRVDKTRTVQTRVEWIQGGQKVYVTGTPFQWSRKQRLHPA